MKVNAFAGLEGGRWFNIPAALIEPVFGEEKSAKLCHRHLISSSENPERLNRLGWPCVRKRSRVAGSAMLH